jgi:hypothetical protein
MRQPLQPDQIPEVEKRVNAERISEDRNNPQDQTLKKCTNDHQIHVSSSVEGEDNREQEESNDP